MAMLGHSSDTAAIISTKSVRQKFGPAYTVKFVSLHGGGVPSSDRSNKRRGASKEYPNTPK
jgi:hypothetical protein